VEVKIQGKFCYLWHDFECAATGIAIWSFSNNDGLAQNTSSPFIQAEVVAGHGQSCR
jgi:hypothetical protein